MLCSLFIFGLLQSSALGHILLKRQDTPSGPVDPSTISDCTYYDTAVDSSYNCEYFEDYWGLTAAQFLDYNPSVLSDCSGIVIGNSYCVEENYGKGPVPTTTSTTSSITSTSSKTSTTAGPSPTQTGIISTCNAYYEVISGDSCQGIVDKYGNFTLAQFYSWNPAVGSSCSTLFIGYYVCVGVPDLASTTTTSSVTTTSATATGPSPTQTGIISTCDEYYDVVSGDTCQGIVDRFGTFTLAQFYSWNPAVGSSCASLFVGYYVCVGVPGTPTSPTTTSTTTTSTTPTSTAPSPLMPSVISSCKTYHLVVSGDGCYGIEQTYGITATQFNTWNPYVGSDCANLWLGYYICVGA